MTDARKAYNILLSWISLIKEDEEYYFAKAMDLFYSLPAIYKKGFLSYITSVVDNEDWENKLDDETYYPEVIKSVLFYYSGRKASGEPTQVEFAEDVIANYLRSSEFKDLRVKDISFSSSLEEV